jgi:hypothetical protein
MCDHEDDLGGIDAREMSILLGISEEMAEEERERQRLLKELEPKDEDEP